MLEGKGDWAMAMVCNSKDGGSVRGGTVRSLYESAMREVRADPVAAVTKYQPTWIAGLSPGPPRAANGADPKRAGRRSR